MTDPLPNLDYAAPRHRGRLDYAALLGRLGPLIGVLFVFLLFTALVNVVDGASPFATPANLALMLRHTTVIAIAALGMTMIIISGGIDLSVGASLALGSVVVALVLRETDGANANLAALAGVASSAAVGLTAALLITGLKLPPFIVTLGMWGSVRGIALGIAMERAKNPRIYPYPPPPAGGQAVERWRDTWLEGLVSRLPADREWMLFPRGVWLMLVLAVVVAAVLHYTRFGRHVFAIGSNEATARLCGVPVARTKIILYTLAGVLAGIASVIDFSYGGAGDATGRLGAELNVIAAVVIGGASLSGGQGSVAGTLLGALLMTMVENGCTKLGLANWVQLAVTGVIIVLAVTLDRLRHRRA